MAPLLALDMNLIMDNGSSMNSTIRIKQPPTPKAASASAIKQSRFVRFDEGQNITHSFSKNYSKKEENDIWYNQKDLAKIKKDNHDALLLHAQYLGREEERDVYKNDWTWRGFDYVRIPYRRTQLRKEHMQGVVQFSHVLGSSSSIALADFARNSSHTNGSIARAKIYGKQNEEESHAIRCGPSVLKGYTVEVDSDDETVSTASLSSSELSSAPASCHCFDHPKGARKHCSRQKSFHKASWISMGKFFQCILS